VKRCRQADRILIRVRRELSNNAKASASKELRAQETSDGIFSPRI
jgi:hypothetical protein